jgi:hypothetical protein
MPDQKQLSPKGKKKMSRLFIPAGLTAVSFGWALSRFVPEGAALAQTMIELDMSQGNIRAAVSETILAIDRELGKVKNAEHRKVLVDLAYRLKDMIMRAQVQEMPDSSARESGSWLS